MVTLPRALPMDNATDFVILLEDTKTRRKIRSFLSFTNPEIRWASLGAHEQIISSRSPRSMDPRSDEGREGPATVLHSIMSMCSINTEVPWDALQRENDKKELKVTLHDEPHRSSPWHSLYRCLIGPPCSIGPAPFLPFHKECLVWTLTATPKTNTNTGQEKVDQG